MPILKPSENIKAIVSMIRNASEFVVIVSPYSNLTGWEDLKDAINKASGRKTDVSYYVREGQGSNAIEDLKVKIYEVPMLHAKMFFSEKEAIIGSFHLMNNNDINWAYKLRSEEYKDLISFFDLYIEPLAIPFEKKQ